MGYGYYSTTSYVKEDLLLPVEEFAKMAKTRLNDQAYVSSSSYGVYRKVDVQEESNYGSFILSMEGEDEDDDDHWEDIVADNRQLQPMYMREKEDPRHRMGDLLEACFDIYRDLKRERRLGPNPKTFYRWLDDIPEWERIVMIRNMLAIMGITESEKQWAIKKGMKQKDFIRQVNLKPSMVKAFLYGVAYLDKAGRKQYKLAFAPDGGVRLGNRPFDTTNHRTVFSGRGWAIWVLSPKGNFYAGNHIKGQFHHSSFLAGEPVKCGGEMVVRAGSLLLLTGKSGHYRPEISNFAYSVKVLRDNGVDLDKLKVMVWKSVAAQTPVAISAARFMENPNKYSIWGQGKLDPKEWDPLLQR